MAATTEEVPRPYDRGTSSVVSFVVAMNRVDVVDLVVDLFLTLPLTLTLLTLTLPFRSVMVHVLFYFHLASWPRLVLFVFGPDGN